MWVYTPYFVEEPSFLLPLPQKVNSSTSCLLVAVGHHIASLDFGLDNVGPVFFRPAVRAIESHCSLSTLGNPNLEV